MTEARLTFRRGPDDGRLVVAVQGEVDVANATSFVSAVRSEVDRRPTSSIVVHLDDVAHFGAAGINALLALAGSVAVRLVVRRSVEGVTTTMLAVFGLLDRD